MALPKLDTYLRYGMAAIRTSNSQLQGYVSSVVNVGHDHWNVSGVANL